MYGKVKPEDYDATIKIISRSQHDLLELLLELQSSKKYPSIIHASTDITGFGLLGHLGEMLESSNRRLLELGSQMLQIKLNADAIPAFNGALNLFEAGYSSTLAPANRRALNFLLPEESSVHKIELSLGEIVPGSGHHKSILELIVDPQTCGPLLISCGEEVANELMLKGTWKKIGGVQ